jgi:hypothetical protein
MHDLGDWYRSYIRHQKQVVRIAELPTPEELENHPHVWNGWL